MSYLFFFKALIFSFLCFNSSLKYISFSENANTVLNIFGNSNGGIATSNTINKTINKLDSLYNDLVK